MARIGGGALYGRVGRQRKGGTPAQFLQRVLRKSGARCRGHGHVVFHHRGQHSVRGERDIRKYPHMGGSGLVVSVSVVRYYLFCPLFNFVLFQVRFLNLID
mgnify:CR=1 FL=1